MGNMADFSINRWGFNLFWLEHFYSNFKSSSLFWKFIGVDALLMNFFRWGYLNSNALNVNSKYTRTSHLMKTLIPIYFRWVDRENPLDSEKKSLRLRIANDSLFFSRLWFLRFQSNIVLISSYYNLVELDRFVIPILSPQSPFRRTNVKVSATISPTWRRLNLFRIWLLKTSPQFSYWF